MLTKEDVEQMKRESGERRKAHPGWPSHKPTMFHPGGRVEVHETMPTGKIKHHGACKYCHSAHDNWWAMDPRENMDGEPLLLCGRCEHTSLKGFTETDNKEETSDEKTIEMMVYAHTKPGSQHQHAALEMLKVQRKRYTPKIRSIVCAKCHESYEVVRWTDKGKLVDTWGYMELDKLICCQCLGEDWIGDILAPKKSK